jgi:hypothetical protein
MVKRRRTDNTMVKRRTDNTMVKGRRTDNTMDKRIVLSVLLRFSAFDYFFGIFTL